MLKITFKHSNSDNQKIFLTYFSDNWNDYGFIISHPTELSYFNGHEEKPEKQHKDYITSFFPKDPSKSRDTQKFPFTELTITEKGIEGLDQHINNLTSISISTANSINFYTDLMSMLSKLFSKNESYSVLHKFLLFTNDVIILSSAKREQLFANKFKYRDYYVSLHDILFRHDASFLPDLPHLTGGPSLPIEELVTLFNELHRAIPTLTLFNFLFDQKKDNSTIRVEDAIATAEALHNRFANLFDDPDEERKKKLIDFLEFFLKRVKKTTSKGLARPVSESLSEYLLTEISSDNFIKWIGPSNIDKQDIKKRINEIDKIVNGLYKYLCVDKLDDKLCLQLGQYTSLEALPYLTSGPLMGAPQNNSPKAHRHPRLRLTYAQQLNDPTEGWDLIQKLESYLKYNNFNSSGEVNTESHPSAYFLASITPYNDDISMWTQYADDGSGIFIKFSTDLINFTINSKLLFKVAYLDSGSFNSRTSNKYPIKPKVICPSLYSVDNSNDDTNKEQLGNLIQDRLHDLFDKIDHLWSLGVTTNLPFLLAKIRFLFKDIKYSHENEFRILDETALTDESIFCKGGDYKEPYSYILYKYLAKPGTDKEDVSLIDKVTLGPKLASNKDFLVPYLHSCHIKNVDISNVKYR